MSRPGALLLMTAGVVLGSHYVAQSPDTSGDLAEITRISVAPDRTYREREVIPTFAPALPAFREAAADGSGHAATVAVLKPGTWTTVISDGRPVVSPVRSSRPADPQTRTQLARDLQHELQRVGCYRGQITGTWNLATRRAMSAFMDRANAVLPFDQPDYVLLALVQSHHDIACSAACPSGQVMQDDGRCVPEAVVAQIAKRQHRLELRRTTVARLAEERAREGVAVSEPSEPEVLPWRKTQTAAAATDVAIAPRPDPLPGRMSIGGPVPAPENALPPESVAERPPVLPAQRQPDGQAKLAVLQYEPDTDDLSDDTGATADIPAPPIGTESDVATHQAKRSRRSDSERRHNSYAYSGKRRRGDPRPGTARYNLMQSLGGVY